MSPHTMQAMFLLATGTSSSTSISSPRMRTCPYCTILRSSRRQCGMPTRSPSARCVLISVSHYLQLLTLFSSQNLYACAELAQHLIKAHAKTHSWNLETYPGKVRLPGDILRALPSADAANQVRCERCSAHHSNLPLLVDLEDGLSPGGGADLAC